MLKLSEFDDDGESCCKNILYSNKNEIRGEKIDRGVTSDKRD